MCQLIVPHHIEYLILDPDLIIQDYSVGAQRLTGEEIPLKTGIMLDEYFPETVGLEDILVSVLSGELDSFDLKAIARSPNPDTHLYIDLYFIPDPHSRENQRLILFLEDVTPQMELEQRLVQATNENAIVIHRLQEKTTQLAAANQEIDHLNQQLQSENIRLSAELEILREMQQLILPKPEDLARIQELDITGYMQPADEVGGDYYDVISMDGVITIGIGDVTGHGLESGILMLMTQTAVRTLKETKEHDPIHFLDILNRTIYKNVQSMGIDKNLTLSILNYAEGQLTVSGQHEEIIVVRQGGTIERIDTLDLGLPIGLDDNIAEFISYTGIDLNPGDGVVLYTDGITEARNGGNQRYGIERLCQIISENWQKTSEPIKTAIIEDLQQFIGAEKILDDITLVVLKQNYQHNLFNESSSLFHGD
ncbi:PP2C family protein-serine/threonine phosphatase [Roseofilum capinflatum]|uniref:PP2C family protein-serine/threonine phosphatase n=1 Tax=Roseofilum capinflatum TaxID=3082943 RepID=UPI0024BE0F5D|nr:PP2C family protein-serine/threonine phosphatase [Roseofilum capinflatum]